MSLALKVLSGPRQNELIPLISGLNLHAEIADNTSSPAAAARVSLDQKKHWNINALDGSVFGIGSHEKEHLTLLVGLVFRLGSIDFKVVEISPSLKPEDLFAAAQQWLSAKDWQNAPTLLSFEEFLLPLRLRFIAGPLIHEELWLSYGPRQLGSFNLDLNLKDPSWPQSLFTFYNKDGALFVQSSLPQKTLVNDRAFEHHAIQDGDVLAFGAHKLRLNFETQL